jgi:hypothetical protein
MARDGEVEPRAARVPGRPRGWVFVAVVALALGVAVAVSTLGSSPAKPGPRSPQAEATTTISEPTPTDSTTAPAYLVETALPAIGGLALGGQPIHTALTRSDQAAVNGAWSVVVRRADGSLGRHGAVVTYPAGTSDFANTGAPIRVGSTFGISGPGFVLWPLGGRHARVRGDLPQADLVHIAELTTVVAGRPQVRPPAGFRVIARAPYRLPLIHEIRYGSSKLGLNSALGDGITYTALTSGGGFEDALYATGATPAGTVNGAPAVVSSVQGGNGSLAWEPSAGVVAYVGWSGAPISAKAINALRDLAQGTYVLTPRQWLATKPNLNEQENNPTN